MEGLGQHGAATAQHRFFSAASNRLVSSCDMHELAGLAAEFNIQITARQERRGYALNFNGNALSAGSRRPPGAPGAGGHRCDGARADSARKSKPTTARQQKRFERGQRLAQERKSRMNTSSLAEIEGAVQPVEPSVPSEEACWRRTASSTCAI